MARRKNLVGLRFGRYTVIGDDEFNKSKAICRCDCGNVRSVYRTNLTGGYSRSCGCLGHEHSVKACKTHGGTRTRLYSVWSNMRRRCYDERNNRYHRYGGRGIKVCDEWLDFGAFRDWAIENGYDPKADYGKCTLDRINTDGDYEPDNCHWVSIQVQNDNRSTAHLLEYNGKTMSITQWERYMNYPHGSIDNRIRKGWSIERAITTPVVKR